MDKKNYLLQMLEEENKLFRRVRDCIMDKSSRSLTLDEVAKESGVDRKLISKWVNEGKLVLGKPTTASKNDFINEIIKSRDELIKEIEKKIESDKSQTLLVS